MNAEVDQINFVEEPAGEPAPLPMLAEPAVVDEVEEPLTVSEPVLALMEAKEADVPMQETVHEAQEIEFTPEVASSNVSEECKAVIIPEVSTPVKPQQQYDS